MAVMITSPYTFQFIATFGCTELWILQGDLLQAVQGL